MISLLLNRAQWAAYHQKGRGINMQAGENLPLQILLWQVCRLLSLPITPVFIFDGPKRPKIKRGRQVKSTPHALMSAYMQLLKAAGFYAYIVFFFSLINLNYSNRHSLGTWRGRSRACTAQRSQYYWCNHHWRCRHISLWSYLYYPNVSCAPTIHHFRNTDDPIGQMWTMMEIMSPSTHLQPSRTMKISNWPLHGCCLLRFLVAEIIQ